jgi:hypothetical protein
MLNLVAIMRMVQGTLTAPSTRVNRPDVYRSRRNRECIELLFRDLGLFLDWTQERQSWHHNCRMAPIRHPQWTSIEAARCSYPVMPVDVLDSHLKPRLRNWQIDHKIQDGNLREDWMSGTSCESESRS